MGGGEEGSPVWRGDAMRRDMVMGDIRMHSPHNVDSYAGESKLLPDVKESDSGQHFSLLNFGPIWSNYCTVFGAAAALERSDLELEPEPVVLLLPATATWPEISVRSQAREERWDILM